MQQQAGISLNEKLNVEFVWIVLFRPDSEESDDEGGLGNVNRVVMRPPGHSGKAKKGHICMDASFETGVFWLHYLSHRLIKSVTCKPVESGNLGRIDYINEFEYDLYIRPDSCNPRHRFWFNFTIDNVRADQVSSRWSSNPFRPFLIINDRQRGWSSTWSTSVGTRRCSAQGWRRSSNPPVVHNGQYIQVQTCC